MTPSQSQRRIGFHLMRTTNGPHCDVALYQVRWHWYSPTVATVRYLLPLALPTVIAKGPIPCS